MNLLSLIIEFKKQKWHGVKRIKAKRRPYLSTNDLDVSGKLYPDYLNRRKERKEKKDEKGYGIPDVGTDDIWPT